MYFARKRRGGRRGGRGQRFAGTLVSWVRTGVSRQRQGEGVPNSREGRKVIVDIKTFQTWTKGSTFRAEGKNSGGMAWPSELFTSGRAGKNMKHEKPEVH